MGGLKRAFAVSALLLGGVTGWAAGAKALPCAEWVSTRIGDAAGVGHLIGTEVITYTIGVAPGGIGTTIETTFEVGTYDFGERSIRIDCRDYTPFEW